MQLNNAIELLVFAAALIGVYVKLQVQLKEFEMRLIAMEGKIKQVEHQDDRIIEKLDELYQKLMDIQIQLQNKQNR